MLVAERHLTSLFCCDSADEVVTGLGTCVVRVAIVDSYDPNGSG